MSRALLYFFLVVFYATLGSVCALEIKELEALKNAKKINDRLQLLFPVNVMRERTSVRTDNGTICADQLTLLQEGLSNGSMWALKMVDSSSKIPSGILMGNRIDLGMFDECMGIRVNEGAHEIRGRHCMYDLDIEVEGLSMSQILSICVPGSCEPEDVQKIIRDTLQVIGRPAGIDVPITVGDTTCTSLDPPDWTPGGIATLTGFGLLLTFLVVCTICDVVLKYFEEKPRRNGLLEVLCHFSLYSYSARIFATKKKSQTLSSIQGIRFYSMCWVIMGHSHIMAFFQPTVNPVDMIRYIPTWNSLHIVLAPFAVDSFFAISGFLMSFVFLKHMSTGKSFNIFDYYLHRYLRLTPSLAAVLLITIFITPRVGSGANWESGATFEEEDCRRCWWTIIFYLQNYIKMERQGCLGHTWYLAVEMHFFWISPLILYPLAKKPKLGLAILAAFFIASIATPVKIGYDREYSSAIISGHQFSGDESFMDSFYFASHVRAAPWLVGIFFGYLTFTNKGTPPSRAIKWIGWILATAAFSFSVLTVRIFENENYRYNIIWESFYTGLAKPFWGFGVSWVIYACVHGFGGFVSSFLSFSFYDPICRISYCVYLAHYQIQYMKARALRTSSYFSPFTGMDHFFSDLFLSIVAGFVLTLIIEMPFQTLEGLVRVQLGQKMTDSRKVPKVDRMENGTADTTRG